MCSIHSAEDTALPLLYEREKAAARLSSFAFSSLPADDRLVDAWLCLEAQSRDSFVAEAEKSLACASVSVWEEVAEERKAVARSGHSSKRRSQGGGVLRVGLSHARAEMWHRVVKEDCGYKKANEAWYDGFRGNSGCWL